MNHYKYPRTFHLPNSPGFTSGDKVLKDFSSFKKGEMVVVTEKMDGENTTMYTDYIHARSIDSKSHSSRDYVKRLHGEIGHIIPEGYRICGENMFAKHSIHYTNLTSYFLAFSVWNGDTCLSWEDTRRFLFAYFGYDFLLNCTVPVIYQGSFDLNTIIDSFIGYSANQKDEVEGFVIRKANGFYYDEFSDNVAKFVRKNHVQTDEHWMNSKIITNRLRSK